MDQRQKKGNFFETTAVKQRRTNDRVASHELPEAERSSSARTEEPSADNEPLGGGGSSIQAGTFSAEQAKRKSPCH